MVELLAQHLGEMCRNLRATLSVAKGPLSGNSGRYFDLIMIKKRGRFRPEADIGASEVTRVNRGRKFLQEYNGAPRDSLT